MASLDALFAPLRLGAVDLPNRIVSTAHQTTLVHDHLPTHDFLAYHEARARGGVGLIIVEATAVHPSGLLTPHTLAGYKDEIVPAWERLNATARSHGTRVFAQLFHGGREQITSPPRSPAVAPSAIPSQRLHVEPRALSEAEIEEIVAGYARAAELAAAGGLDGVEVSAAHNYLVAQFFTPELNQRTDAWGEPARFLLAVLDAVRAAAPGIALGVRLSADSEAARAVAPELMARVDYVSLALGDSSTHLGSALIVPPPPFEHDLAARLTRPFRVGSPLVVTSRTIEPEAAARLVADGIADAVGMTRALITDPDLPRKARAGRQHDVVRCIGCNVCIAHYHAGTPIACAQNPRTGRERTLPRPVRAERLGRLVVVGAGPAGLAAAAEAGAAGHEVVVLERADRIGGQAALAASSPGHAELGRTLAANYRMLIAAAGVELRLGAEASADAIEALAPDAVVVATGAVPYAPPFSLADVDVLQAFDVLAGARPAGRRVVVADWGGDPTGLDAAELLRAGGKEVVVAVAAAAVGETLHQYSRNLYLQRLYRAGVRFEHHLELAGAGRGHVRFRNVFAPELEVALETDALVLALGRVPADGELAAELSARGLALERAGDCLGPRSLEEAILEGTLSARRLIPNQRS